jgi:hypothetical protein
MQDLADELSRALRAAGMTDVPDRFSVARVHQEIPCAAAAELDAFVRVFESVTTRPEWQRGVTASAPEIARHVRPEVCFFSAWDFHLPPEPPGAWQLIEFNDNGSGLLLAALVNRLFYELSGLAGRADLAPPPGYTDFAERVADIVESEARRFFGALPEGLFLILDDAESLERGRFRSELVLLRDLLRRRGRKAEIAAPERTRWDGRRLFAAEQAVCFVVNRSTDFFWEASAFAPLRAAYAAGSAYVAPNPFTYATRSDKRLLELLSRPDRDRELGIRPEERAVLGAHVPETRLLREETIEELARRRAELVFKPTHGFAGRGLLESSRVGRSRLRRLLQQGRGYVAQKRVPKPSLRAAGDGSPLWTDLRLWAYRGERLLLSGRASRRADVLDLAAPGGWLPTFLRTRGDRGRP